MSPCQRFGTAHGFRSRVGGLSEPCQSDEADRDQSALGRGYHLPSPEEGACLPGCDSRRVFAESGGLGVGSDAGKAVAVAALQQAIVERKPQPGLVHHSDRGVQYASGEYVKVLREHQMIPSMSRPANPYENASCESFLKTLKWEEIYAKDYRD